MQRKDLHRAIERQIDLEERSRRGRTSLLARTVYLGSVGIMLTLPIVAGAYMGRWLDEHTNAFSFSWTVSLIVIGVLIGATNVTVFIRQTWD
ncbi:MAG TPA: AtpZ/AtpI family protein [Candidatus Acidoferrales bacterium]|nr:AtpZ/AtpI family protein [Candidatus Acidoferrales bacterium]